LQRRLNTHDVFGVKDPRMALLLPLWKSVFAACDVQVSYVLAVRNPLSVSSSLARRNAFTFEKCATLWLLHCVAMLEGTEAENARVLVDYDLLMSSPRDEILRIGRALDLEVLPSALDEYETEFLDPGLRHFENRPDDPGLGRFQGTLLQDFYGALRDVASARMTLEDPRLAEQLQAAKRLLSRPPQTLSDGVR
jgi:O-antigen biosynthesis protein